MREGRWENKGQRSVAHLTAVGHVRLTRRVWWQAKEGVAAPADGWLNGSGMRWDPAGASAMLNLAALNDSNEWDAYWQFQGAHMN